MWGLLSLLPQVIAFRLRHCEYSEVLKWIGYLGFPVALSIATGRALHSVNKVRETIALLGTIIIPILILLSWSFEVDVRQVPLRIRLFPFPLRECSPVNVNEMGNLILTTFFYITGAASAVRIAIGNTVLLNRHLAAILFAGITFTLLLIVNLIVGTLPYDSLDRESEERVIVEFYIIVLAYGFYFVALFYDFNATSTTASTSPKTPEPL